MRRIAFLLLAAASLLGSATAETRPRYGGTLRIMMQAPLNSLELAAGGSTAEYWDSARLTAMIGDTLLRVDLAGRPQPGLAESWQATGTRRGLQLTLRRGVKFHDGSPAFAEAVAHILGEKHPEWTVRSAGDTLTIESDMDRALLAAELALPANAILKRSPDGMLLGTGPFRIADFQPGKSVKLSANEDSWAGRPFVDAIEVELGRSLRDQAIALELGKADVVESGPQPLIGGSPRVRTSLPVELLALVFPENTRAQDARVREALALAVDRKPIQSALLKGAGEVTAAILPNWMTGYAPAFLTQPNVQRARAALADSRQPALSLSYDPRDPQAQLIAERLALNAREAGITLQVSLSGPPDVSLVRIALPSADPGTSLRQTARALSLAQPLLQGATLDDLYNAERGVLEGHRIIPLLHLPVAVAAGNRVRSWQVGQAGEWNLPDVWLEPEAR